MPIQEGFRGQRLVVVPRPVVSVAMQRPVTRRLVVTDAGYYPHASNHRMRRRDGTAEYIVIVCATGVGWVRLGDELHRVGARQALVVPAAAAHEYGADDDNPWSIWWAHLGGADVPELIDSIGVSAERPVVSVRAVERVVALLDEIVTALERAPSRAKMLAAAGSAWKLLTQIAVDQLLPSPGDPLQRAMTYLEERLDGSILVTDLAALVGVSPSHLSALFHRATGGGVLAHHTALRMARARLLLDTTDATIAEIGREIGYEDAFYFSRQFRRHHGSSPTAYRSRNS
jgi:AraC-like DNA-binding protein